ncbi:hypothetical protein [Veillonella caviae]|uniref:hypothetical protein n=1 Tax=Veillonella caviae TaxID=248316 RepID=UPI000F8D7C28|nr:hypothetical protein [Veillonella caviae]MCI5709277.1 hypothetical protein [Veillonella caviae]MDY5715641.1 hypothetical protein [Veillonella caviae]
MASYGEILAKFMYKDRCTISRQIETIDDIGADVFAMVDVYSDVPCKVGQIGQTSMSGVETDSVFALKNHLRLSLPIEYDILPNDIVTIYHKGQTFVMRTDTPFKYMSHQEVNLIKEGDA